MIGNRGGCDPRSPPYWRPSGETFEASLAMAELTLAQLRAAAEGAQVAFLTACRAHGFSNEWEAYRAEQRGEVWPSDLAHAHDEWMRDLHAFYLRRRGV
jgi:hypothetical protein